VRSRLHGDSNSFVPRSGPKRGIHIRHGNRPFDRVRERKLPQFTFQKSVADPQRFVVKIIQGHVAAANRSARDSNEGFAVAKFRQSDVAKFKRLSDAGEYRSACEGHGV